MCRFSFWETGDICFIHLSEVFSIHVWRQVLQDILWKQWTSQLVNLYRALLYSGIPRAKNHPFLSVPEMFCSDTQQSRNVHCSSTDHFMAFRGSSKMFGASELKMSPAAALAVEPAGFFFVFFALGFEALSANMSSERKRPCAINLKVLTASWRSTSDHLWVILPVSKRLHLQGWCNFLPTSSLNIDFASTVFFVFDFFSFGLLEGRSANMSVSSWNKSSSFVCAFFGRFVALGTAVGGAANMSESSC